MQSALNPDLVDQNPWETFTGSCLWRNLFSLGLSSYEKLNLFCFEANGDIIVSTIFCVNI